MTQICNRNGLVSAEITEGFCFTTKYNPKSVCILKSSPDGKLNVDEAYAF